MKELSDEQLNRAAAEKVMGWAYPWPPAFDPCNEWDDAMMLVEKLKDTAVFSRFVSLAMDKTPCYDNACNEAEWFARYVTPRIITESALEAVEE